MCVDVSSRFFAHQFISLPQSWSEREWKRLQFVLILLKSFYNCNAEENISNFFVFMMNLYFALV